MSSELGTFLAYVQRGLSKAFLYTNSYIPGQSLTPHSCVQNPQTQINRHFPEWDSQLLFGHRAAVSHDLILPRLFSVPHPNNHYRPLPILSPSPPPTQTQRAHHYSSLNVAYLLSLSSKSTDFIS